LLATSQMTNQTKVIASGRLQPAGLAQPVGYLSDHVAQISSSGLGGDPDDVRDFGGDPPWRSP
jgi:hypothetical protein